MALPTVLFLAIATGLAAALAGRAELKISSRHALLTRTSLAFLIFDFLVLIPSSAYFYVFHGDWFMLYLVDVQLIPSAVALIGFVLQGLLAVGGFALGASLVRSQRESSAVIVLAVSVLGAIAVCLAIMDRLATVGSYAQFHGNFGLVPFIGGPLLWGSLLMFAILVTGLSFLLVRVWLGARRQA